IRDFHVTGVQTCALPILALDSAFIYDTYQWQYQIFDSTLYVDTTGLYIVSVTKNGCSKTASLLVTCVSNPFASIEIPQALNCIRSEERRVGKECRYRWSS